jgi:hypothetical protein
MNTTTDFAAVDADGNAITFALELDGRIALYDQGGRNGSWELPQFVGINGTTGERIGIDPGPILDVAGRVVVDAETIRLAAEHFLPFAVSFTCPSCRHRSPVGTRLRNCTVCDYGS